MYVAWKVYNHLHTSRYDKLYLRVFFNSAHAADNAAKHVEPGLISQQWQLTDVFNGVPTEN